jgi:MtN3 and saliva related transmembrane protein
MQNSELVGIIAGFGTTFAALPDLIRMVRRQSSVGMNPSMPAIMAVFQVVWIYYGVLINARPIIVWNVVAVVINALSVAVYAIYSRRERKLVRGKA